MYIFRKNFICTVMVLSTLNISSCLSSESSNLDNVKRLVKASMLDKILLLSMNTVLTQGSQKIDAKIISCIEDEFSSVIYEMTAKVINRDLSDSEIKELTIFYESELGKKSSNREYEILHEVFHIPINGSGILISAEEESKLQQHYKTKAAINFRKSFHLPSELLFELSKEYQSVARSCLNQVSSPTK